MRARVGRRQDGTSSDFSGDCPRSLTRSHVLGGFCPARPCCDLRRGGTAHTEDGCAPPSRNTIPIARRASLPRSVQRSARCRRLPDGRKSLARRAGGLRRTNDQRPRTNDQRPRTNDHMSDSLRVREVIFDVDGTLVDSLAAYRVVAERAAAPYGLTISDAVVRDALNPTRPFWDLALPPDFADRAETMEKLRREAARLWREVVPERGRSCPDAET